MKISKFFEGKTNLHDKGIPNEYPHFNCIPLILVDSVFKTGKKY